MGWLVCVSMPVYVISNASHRLCVWKHWPLCCSSYPQIYLICFGRASGLHWVSHLFLANLQENIPVPLQTFLHSTCHHTPLHGVLLGLSLEIKRESKRHWRDLEYPNPYSSACWARKTKICCHKTGKEHVSAQLCYGSLTMSLLKCRLHYVEFCGSLCLKGKP